MATIEEYRSFGKEIEDVLRLDSFTLAVKMIQTEEEIPAAHLSFIRNSVALPFSSHRITLQS